WDRPSGTRSNGAPGSDGSSSRSTPLPLSSLAVRAVLAQRWRGATEEQQTTERSNRCDTAPCSDAPQQLAGAEVRRPADRNAREPACLKLHPVPKTLTSKPRDGQHDSREK